MEMLYLILSLADMNIWLLDKVNINKYCFLQCLLIQYNQNMYFHCVKSVYTKRPTSKSNLKSVCKFKKSERNLYYSITSSAITAFCLFVIWWSSCKAMQYVTVDMSARISTTAISLLMYLPVLIFLTT